MKKLLYCLLALILPVVSFAQPSAKAIRELDEFIEKIRTEWNIPAVAVGIVKDNQIVYAKGFGYADIENQRKADENTLFAIGSSSKAFTALSVMQLVDDGLVELDKPVLNYLPGLRMHDDYVTSHLTVRDLLSHRSGLPRHDMVWYGAPDSREELFGKLKYLEPSAGFREIFQYQNLMYMTAGYLVGQTRHSTWEEAVKTRIFDPLGMTRSNFSVDKMQEDANFALPYRKEDDMNIQMEFRNIDAVGPAGSINSSVTEMASWLLMHLNNGKFNETEVVSYSSLIQCYQSIIAVPGAWYPLLGADMNDGPVTYGLGWFISSHNGHRAISHGGNIDGFSAMVGLLPAESIGVVVLTNQNGNPVPGIIRNYIYDVLLDEEREDWNSKMHALVDAQGSQEDQEDLIRIAGTHPSHNLADYAGTYEHPAYGTINVSVAEGDSLKVDYHAFSLTAGHYHYDVFQGTGPSIGSMKVAFNSDVGGNIYELTASLESQTDPIRFSRAASEVSLSTEELEAITGDYLIQGVQKVTVSVEDGQLKLTVPGQPKYSLEYKKGLEFALKELKGFSAIFQKNPDGDVTSFVMVQPNGQFKGERVE